MTFFHAYFGADPPALGTMHRIDYDKKPRPDVAFSRQRGEVLEAAEDLRKSGNFSEAVRGYVLVVVYDLFGRLRGNGFRTDYRWAPAAPAWGIYRQVDRSMARAELSLEEVEPLFRAEVEALLGYLPPYPGAPEKDSLWVLFCHNLAQVGK